MSVAPSQPAASGEASWQQLETRLVETADAIKAMADPLRLRVLQLLMVAPDRSWSVKEIASELAQPVTKLYHHIKLLESASLITDVESRLVSGIVEHRYRASQKTLRFAEGLFGTPETLPDSIGPIAALIDNTRDDLIDYLNREDADFERISISKSTGRLTPEEVASIDQAIEEIRGIFLRARDDDNRSEYPHTSMLLLVSPLGHEPE